MIWGKTYPELSKKHFETVCTAGVLEDGRVVRLYPISYRYLNDQFSLYQWINARIAKNPNDARPESYKIDCESIKIGEVVKTTSDEWGRRAEIMFRNPAWVFETMEKLAEAQKANRTSIGVVAPRKIIKVEVVPRSDDEKQSFQEKFEEIKKELSAKLLQIDMFEQSIPEEMKTLDFLGSRLQVSWLCHNPDCNGHKMQVLDWGVCELQRRDGDATALKRMLELCNLEKYALRFFLGNLYLHPGSFMIVGMWYPKLANLLFH